MIVDTEAAIPVRSQEGIGRGDTRGIVVGCASLHPPYTVGGAAFLTGALNRSNPTA